MISLLVDIIGAGRPLFVEGVLYASGDVNGIGSLVVGADEVAGGCGAALEATRAGERVGARAAGESAGSGGCVGVVDSLKRGRPAVLGEVVIVQAESGAQHGVLAAHGRIDDSEPRRNLLAVIVGQAGDNRNLQRLQRNVRTVLSLGSARTLEEPVGGLVTEAVVDREVMRDAPGILAIEGQPLHVLREAAVAGGSVSASDAGGRWVQDCIARQAKRNKTARRW